MLRVCNDLLVHNVFLFQNKVTMERRRSVWSISVQPSPRRDSTSLSARSNFLELAVIFLRGFLRRLCTRGSGARLGQKWAFTSITPLMSQAPQTWMCRKCTRLYVGEFCTLISIVNFYGIFYVRLVPRLKRRG